MSGDIIVLATDGLWDNVTENEIVKQLAGLKPGDVQVRSILIFPCLQNYKIHVASNKQVIDKQQISK